jgi:hypothetical protein
LLKERVINYIAENSARNSARKNKNTTANACRIAANAHIHINEK